jgi:hypothetical protein
MFAIVEIGGVPEATTMSDYFLGTSPLAQNGRWRQRDALWCIGAAARFCRSIPRENYKCSIRGRNTRRTTAMKKHNHSSDDRPIQYRGKYSRHSRGQALTNIASDRHTGATCLKPSRRTIEALALASLPLVSSFLS